MDQAATAEPAALLEREYEVERVHATVHATGQRAGRVLVLEGAAGMGKTRLLDHGAELQRALVATTGMHVAVDVPAAAVALAPEAH